MQPTAMKPVGSTGAQSQAERLRRFPLLSPSFGPKVLPFLIALVALVLRLQGTDWDGGNFYHPDERSIYMRAECMYRVLTDAPGWQNCVNRDFPMPTPGLPSLSTFFDADVSPLNPHWFPLGSILIYMLVAAAYLVDAVGGPVTLGDLATVGRTLTALADAGSVLLMYFLGRRLFGTAAGLLASTLLAFTVVNIQQAHFYRPEAFVVLLALGAFWWMLNVLERGRLRDHVGLGVFVGLSFAFRASSLPILASVALAYGVLAWRRWHFERGMVPEAGLLATTGKAALAGATAFGVFAVLQPYALLDFGKFVSDLVWEAGVARTAGSVPYTVQYVGMTASGLYEVRQSAVWGLGLPLGVLAWGGFVASVVAVLFRRHLGELLLVAWVVAVLFTIVGFEVKFLRYVSVVLPVLVLLGARWLIAAYGYADKHSPALRRAVLGIGAFIVAATVFYALAFVASYGREHPAVQASEWLNANAPPGAIVLTDNHWDEGFPNLGTFNVAQLPMYEGDDLGKVWRVSELLAVGDYIVAYSNRPWGSIARLPGRYPYSSAYYRALFSGELGYELVHAFERYPALMGVAFTHDPFTRAGVERPETLPGIADRPLMLDLGYADENVTNYDRPLVLVWRNVERLSADEIAAIMLSGGTGRSGERAMLSPAQLQVQREGGTWTELFVEGGLNGAVPWLVWLVLVEVIFVATLPLAVRLFRWLPDRGVVLARPLGLLLVAWVVWLGATVGAWSFSRATVLLSVGVVATASVAAILWGGRDILAQVRQRWRYLASAELLFISAYLVFVLIRAANPDLWHPWRGGEKPMDLAYLTAVVKSTTFPAYDPWFAGGYINYYYFGFVIVGMLIKATGIVPAVAYNLAVPLLFALAFTGVFAVSFNLAESLRARRPHSPRWSAAVAGLVAAFLVAVLGNLDGAGQLLEGVYRWVTRGAFPAFDYWRSSRLMPDEISINEFPFWTFLFADLHAHLIAIPFQILALGLLANLALSTGDTASMVRRLPALAVAAWAVGSLAAMNTWDVPVYGLLALVVLGIVMLAAHWPDARRMALRWALWAAVFWSVLYLSWLPFHQHYEAPFSGLRMSRWRTELWQYLAIHGLLLFITVSWLLHQSRRHLWARGELSSGPGAAPVREAPPPATRRRRRAILVAGGVFSLVVWLAIPALREWTTALLLVVLLALTVSLAAWWALRERGPEASTHILLLAMLAAAFGIGIGVDVVTLGNDIDRMNTVFKFYLNAWVLYGVVGGVGIWHLWVSGAFARGSGSALRRRLWLGGLTALVLSAAVFPVAGTRARLADRFDTAIPLTLDGTAYQRVATYYDPGPEGGHGGAYDLVHDAEALGFLRQNVEGSPVVLEGVTTQYRWTPRVAKYTGLPVVIGYEWHQIQQRGMHDGREAVLQRVRDVRMAYDTPSVEVFWQVVDLYEVEYVYVGPMEKLYFSEEGIAKFDRMVGAGLEVFYANEAVTIYRVGGVARG